MKKIVTLLALIASVAIFAGCANKAATQEAAAPSATETAAPAHQDFKGEVGQAK